MFHSRFKAVLFVFLLLSLTMVFACGQLAGGLPSVPGLNSLVSRTPVTTSLNDAQTELPYLDGFAPSRATALTGQPRNEDGAFRLSTPGFYSMTAASYCLHAGTYAPGGGDGYLYAPLKGTRATIISNILKRSVNRMDVPQHDIQLLLWAIVAKTKPHDMSPSLIGTALSLLTKAELASLNDVYIEEQAKKLINANMPPALQRTLEAEAKMRNLMTTGANTYRDIERVAVLTGAAPWGPGSRKTPEGRWSYHPDGYFVSYHPHGYSRTDITVYVPECIKIVRDDEGRIVLIQDSRGNRIEARYNDTSMDVPGDKNVTGWAFSSVKITGGRGGSLNSQGWTFTGRPSGSGSPAAGGVFTDMPARYAWASNFAKTNETVGGQGGGLGAITSIFGGGSNDPSMDLVHFEYALNQAGILRGNDLVRRAWMYEICVMKKKCPAECTPGDNPVTFDPSGSVATPGNTSRQRLATSARPYR